MKVIWSRSASDDLASAHAYLVERSPSAAARTEDRVIGAVDRLEDMPFVGRPGAAAGTRELVVGQTPYKVVYEVLAGEVRILRVLHGRQRWPPD